MKELRDLKDVPIHDVQPVSDESTIGRRHSFRIEGVQNSELVPSSSSQTYGHLNLRLQRNKEEDGRGGV